MNSEQQHKKCSELLRELYCNRDRKGLREEYQKICAWIGMTSIAWDSESLEQRFHEHIRLSGKGLSEHNFLKNLVVGDTHHAREWLGIHTYLDGLRSCHNVGSILRTSEAFRLGPVHFSDDMMAPHHRQIQKTSMGTWDYVETSHGIDMQTLPRPWVAIETVYGATSYNEWIYPKTCSLFVGNEERGIRATVLEQCDTVVTIPLAGCKNSLNVANAFAIVASEIASQHREAFAKASRE
jgi:tRNA G18 (ribose-2'-O)-methylase SpoU